MAAASPKKDRPAVGRSRSTVFWHRLIRSLVYLVAFVFLLLVVIGNVANHPVLRGTYFLKINLANIIPLSVPNAKLINSIAQTIGLHDFYQVGLWNFCEGYEDTGITRCSDPVPFYAFDPVKIILDELLKGATIALPADISRPLRLARIASHWMYGLYLASTVLCFAMIFLAPFAVSSRPPHTISPDPQTNATYPLPVHRRGTFLLLRAIPFTIITFIIAVCAIGASAIATVMFAIYVHVFASEAQQFNIDAWLGIQMLVFMWIGAGFAFLAFVVQAASCCASCCGGRKARRLLKMKKKKNKEQQEDEKK